jgi:PAS domain S-box-containing protein
VSPHRLILPRHKTAPISIRTTLLIIISFLNIVIALLTGYGLYRSWVKLSDANMIQRDSKALNLLYDAEKYLSLERAASMAVLGTTGETRKSLMDELEADRRSADADLTAALGQLNRRGGKELNEAIARVNERYRDIRKLRRDLDAFLARPGKSGMSQLSNYIFEGNNVLISSIKDMIDIYSAPLLRIDPRITQQIWFKYFVWEITEYAGQEYAQIGRLIVESKPPTVDLQQQLLTGRGRIQHGWEIAHMLARTSGLGDRLEPYISEAETHYFLTFDQIKDMFYGEEALKARGPYPITIEIWLELASQAVDSLFALKDASLQETQLNIDRMAGSAERLIIINILLFIFALILSFYSWRVIATRVIMPVNSMINMLYRATRTDPHSVQPQFDKQDEIAKLAGILEVFQKNTLRLEQTSRELEEQRNYLKTVLSTILDAIITFDSEGRLQLVNPAVEKLFGYSEKELLGREAALLLAQPGEAGHDPYLTDFMASGDSTLKRRSTGKGHEMTARRKNGSLFPVEIFITEMGGGGERRIFVGLLRDISQRKKAEDEREHYMRDLENSNRELDDFAYIASHDLKEPLRGLHNFSNFLLEDYRERLDEEGQNMLTTIAGLTQRMEGLLNALLHYSRLGRTEMSIRETDLNEIVKGVIDMYEIRLKETSGSVKILGDLPVIVCDHVRIAEVFQNLIGNALKYNDSKKKTIEIGTREDLPGHLGETVYFVRDNGIGIPEKHRASVFKIFHRLHGKNAYGGGTGSGLTIAKKIINQHGGEIWIGAPEKGSGTVFYFTLPQQAAAAAA